MITNTERGFSPACCLRSRCRGTTRRRPCNQLAPSKPFASFDLSSTRLHRLILALEQQTSVKHIHPLLIATLPAEHTVGNDLMKQLDGRWGLPRQDVSVSGV